MFDQFFHKPSNTEGLQAFIHSSEGDIYVAFIKDADGKIVRQHDGHFHSLSNASEWLKQQGVKDYTFEQSQAYFEMINN